MFEKDTLQQPSNGRSLHINNINNNIIIIIINLTSDVPVQRPYCIFFFLSFSSPKSQVFYIVTFLVLMMISLELYLNKQ